MISNRKAVSSKWVKTQLLLQSPELSSYVPATYRLTRSRLLAMLARYGMLYLKPDRGSLGIGVMRVEKRGRAFLYQSGVQSCSFTAFEDMFQSLQRRIGSRPYLIQKGISLLAYEGRPFDFRVMIQKNPSGAWESTGIVGRVAHPHKVVTNGSQGGTIYPARDLLRPKAGTKRAAGLLQQMDRLARRTAAEFSRIYPAMNELGLDIAIDRNLAPWILEVNTRPDPCPFTKLDNKDSIRKMIAYAKAYGRQYNLVCSKAKRAPRCCASNPAKRPLRKSP
ncbi:MULTISPECIES: YheC/YheD family endospore coat-associated protein [Paenibacillus]|uniref:YheC/YheD family endospore coat-associated protein n=1 Tax=Paenibacillus TaxID=44249 RepID=UPI0022B8A80B|nr:YheC/YheD family protein [Paenibacillus caseinilyticus]MCZ8521326.1 YheC/YheD family protein [Paenibacillus caseinilyticus]